MEDPGNAAYQVAPRKRVIIAGAIREVLAGAPLTLARLYRTRFLGHKFVSCGGPE